MKNIVFVSSLGLFHNNMSLMSLKALVLLNAECMLNNFCGADEGICIPHSLGAGDIYWFWQITWCCPVAGHTECRNILKAR